MNKKIVIGIAVAVIAVVAVTVGLKTILGDKAIELPGEEHTEKSLNVQESSNSSNNTVKPNATSTESTESGP